MNKGEKNYCNDCMGRAGRRLVVVSNNNIDEFKRLKEIEYRINNNERITSKKINAIWLETSGCFGEVISLLNGEKPDIIYFLENLVNMVYFGAISGLEGEKAYEKIIDILNTEYILIISGAIPVKSNGKYTTLATYKGKEVTAMEAVSLCAKNAKGIIEVGTCACYGGPTAASPNVSLGLSVRDYLRRDDVINIPGCPVHPVWLLSSLGYLINYGPLNLDDEGRPVAFYGVTIHSRCPKRSYFDRGIFAKKYGDPECMFKLGCRGPITKVFCPVSRWNESYNWPIGDRTTCIGCARNRFPDAMQPFADYKGGGNMRSEEDYY